ncbi:unnamed protein product [Rotaria sordida]|uniref:Uncharacterized protein n=1 Tax=Rotaria sordida TaxID=392033 RepID=A0A819JP64_9BILA|nr:unnamed protein product [Rotaria sordida]
MTTNKRKRIIAIDSYEFEGFVRTHLSKDLADTLILKLGIRSYNGFVKCDDLNGELLAVHDSIHEQDRLNIFLYNDTLSSSTPNGIKKGNSSSTQPECEPHDASKRSKRHCDICRTTMCKPRTNDTMNDEKFKYREKPITNEDSGTDWSFHQEELLNYETHSDDLKIVDDFIVKEATHIYVTQQRIHHFFHKHMNIKSDDLLSETCFC